MFKLLSENRGKGFFSVENAAQETTIYLYDAIVGTDIEAEYWGGVSAETLVKTIRAVTAPVINLRVNSPGGDVFAARAIEQALRDSAATVIAHIDGYAASAASFMVMAADQIIMAKGAFLMIHKAWTIAIGNADAMTAQAALLDKLDGTLAETYATRSGMEAEAVMQLMAAETWFTAD
ncbi:head maturation protease, ClpP-related, partial [Propionivibrio sp.]|uniref:head maturation protease, ClpP-related n=1 Tax=Propionivibrio sp. TaxID=2212460 RepID=UPI00262F18A1